MEKVVNVTHQGQWKISDTIAIECYVTSDAVRMMSLRETARAMNLVGGGSTAVLRNLKSKYLQPYLSDHLLSWINRASQKEFGTIKPIYGPAFIPFEAHLFADVCRAYTQANIDGVLNKNQKIVAQRLLGIMTAFMKVGLEALIDEITGYQKERKEDEMQYILKKYIAPEFIIWTKTFHDEFFEQLFRLRGWKKFSNFHGKIPQVVGKYINDIVYERLPMNVLEALKAKTPKSEAGHNLKRYHQGLSVEVGRPHLEKHLVAVITLMRISKSWNEFLYNLDELYQKRGQGRFRFLML